MMYRMADKYDRAKDRIDANFERMLTDSEGFPGSTAPAAGGRSIAARTQFRAKLRHAKAALADASQPVFDTTRKTAAIADRYVYRKPWTAVGVAIAAGAILGFLAGKR
ncbi:MAG TPA: hypothetical protein VMP00_04135 [Burkholderiales bacterium]|nr:hypothetical protein [Burkholderiales bacterium]